MARVEASRCPEVPVRIAVDDEVLSGELRLPEGASGLVIFAHGSGSSRHSPRNQFVARTLEQAGLGTLLIDLLTPAEDAVDARTAEYRFDIPMLAERLGTIVDWLRRRADTTRLRFGFFGASTGAGAALIAAAGRPDDVDAIVSRGGRPDLAGAALARVKAPTLLIVGGFDSPVVQMNREAMRRMTGEVRLDIVPGATHLFEEPGTLEQVSRLAVGWCRRYLSTARS